MKSYIWETGVCVYVLYSAFFPHLFFFLAFMKYEIKGK